MIDYKLEHIFTVTGTLAAPPEVIGPLPEGFRVNFYSSGGEITGPKLRGKVRAAGGDWLTVRHDGMAVLDVRATIEMDDGALIDAAYRGLGDLGPDGYDKFVRGDLPATMALRTGPILRSAHPSYQWLQRETFIGYGAVDFARLEVAYDLYAVR